MREQRSRFRTLTAPLAVVMGLFLAGSASAASPPVRVGAPPHHPAASTVVGALAGGTRISLTVTLKPRDPAGLAAYAAAVATPGSNVYHHYLTVAEFRQRYGPTEQAIAAVRAALRAGGLEPRAVSANGLAMSLSSTASAVAHAFSLSFQQVKLHSGRVAFANTKAPQLPASAAPWVQAVIGLDNLVLPRPVGIRHSALAPGRAMAFPHVVTGGPQPCSTASSAAGSNGAYTADQIASAYRFSNLYAAGDQGLNQTVALYELEGNFPSDISAFESCYGISSSVTYQTVDGGPPTPVADQDGIETELDIDNVIGLAPKAKVIVYQGPNSDQGAYDTYSKIVTADTANVVSTSWGMCEPAAAQATVDTPSAEATLFQEAATQGQSVFAAAGDSGSEGCEGEPVSNPSALAVGDPASQPYVTAVGGTTLSPLGPPPGESVWNGGCTSACAGGGGISEFWSMPSYQSGAAASLHVINSNSSGSPCGASSGDCREVPDVSADANPSTGYLIYYDGSWGGIGGTSGAAPLWAALTALTNASSGCASKAIGFANPLLYTSAGNAYSGDFNDVTSGNNDELGTNGGLYPAGAGYDMATGLGTPIGSSLPASLCSSGAAPHALTVTNPGNQTTSSGQPVSLQIQGTDSVGSPTFAATGLPPGLTINSSGLIQGAPTAGGTFSVTVYAYDSTDASSSASFTWMVPRRATSTAVSCTPSSVNAGSSTTCAATVTDTGAGTATTPTGPVTFSASSTGSFTSSSCTLSGSGATASCSVSYTPAAAASQTITASYGGDSTHSGSSGSSSPVTEVSSPPTAVFSGPSSSFEGSIVSFNASSSTDPNPGGSLSYSWSFGDGSTVTGRSVSHIFRAGGYTVTLTVTDSLSAQSSSVSHAITVSDDAPTASFGSTSATAGRPVTFHGSGSDPDGSITVDHWSYGDGGSGSGPSPSHIYSRAGSYTVTLMVFDSSGLTATASHVVTIGPPECVAPRLKGKTLAQARRAIAAADCAIGKVKRARRKPASSPGRHRKWRLAVAGQAPAGGLVRSAGARIALTLAYHAVRA